MSTPNLLSRLTRLSLCLLFLVPGLVSCDEEDSSATTTVPLFDQYVEELCEVEINECPNACVFGTGIVGESCSDSSTCGCGLFCKEGECTPYEAEYAGCLCKDGLPPQAPSFVERCTAATDRALCNDRNPCTVQDVCFRGECVGEPVEFAKSCDDGNTCTTGDICAGAVCQGVEKDDGAVCDDGLLCTVEDLCQAGLCEGSEKSCVGLDSECALGACDPQDGSCFVAPRPNGTACNDENYCTLEDRCEAGVCTSDLRVDCRDQEGECNTASCDPASGACLKYPTAEGTLCDVDDDACTHDMCVAGQCVIQSEVQCGSLCNDGGCNPQTGACDGAPLADGTFCDDGDPCTQNNECKGGVCFVERLLCSCDTLGEGAACDDGNECTTQSTCDADGDCLPLSFADEGTDCAPEGVDACQEFRCTPEGECDSNDDLTSVCSALDLDGNDCKTYACDPSVEGGCLEVNVPDGTTCDDGQQCTVNDQCFLGVCRAGPPRDCSRYNSIQTPCEEYICDESPPADTPNLDDEYCVAKPLSDYTPCVLNICEGAHYCVEGQCENALNEAPNLCDVCANSSAGEDCDDGNPCTLNDRCERTFGSLVCIGDAKECEGTIEGSCSLNICRPDLGGQCEAVNASIGALCDDGDSCSRGDQCNESGACAGVTYTADALGCLADDFVTPDLCADQGPHGTPAQAEQVEYTATPDPMTISGTLTRLQQEHWYAIELDAHSIIEFGIGSQCETSMTAPFVNISLYHPNGLDQLTDPSEGGRVYIPTAGRYLLRASTFLSSPFETPYLLTIDPEAQQLCTEDNQWERCCGGQDCLDGVCVNRAPYENEPNNNQREATRFTFAERSSKKIIGEFTHRNDEDWYKIELESGRTYTLSTSSYCGSQVATELALFEDPDGIPLISNQRRTDDVSPDESMFSLLPSFIPTRAEVDEADPQNIIQRFDYYLRVRPAPNTIEPPFGYYFLNVSDESCTLGELSCACADQVCRPSPVDAGIGVCVPQFSEYEPNESLDELLQTAQSPLRDGARLFGTLNQIGDVDGYIIDLTDSESVLLFETHQYCQSDAVNTHLLIKNSFGEVVAQDDNGGVGRLSRTLTPPLAPGRYTVEISSRGGSTGSYLIESTLISAGEPIENQECVEDADCGCEDLTCEQIGGAATCVSLFTEREPNESPLEASALTLNRRVVGELEETSSRDWYAFNLNASQIDTEYEIELHSFCNDLPPNTFLEILNEDGVVIRFDRDQGEGTLSKIRAFISSEVGRFYVRVSAELPSRGKYVISIKESQSETILPENRRCTQDADCLCDALYCPLVEQGDRLCDFRSGREVEPNDALSLATNLGAFTTEGLQITGRIDSPTDEDRYLVTFTEDMVGQFIQVSTADVCDPPASMDTAIRVFTHQEGRPAEGGRPPQSERPPVLIAEDEDLGPFLLSKIDRVRVNYAGDYHIVVTGQRSAVGAYLLTVEPALEECDTDEACGCADRVCSESDLCVNRLSLLSEGPSLNESRLSAEEVIDDIEAAIETRGVIELLGSIDSEQDIDYFELPFDLSSIGQLYKIEHRAFCSSPLPALSMGLTSAQGTPRPALDFEEPHQEVFRVYGEGSLYVNAQYSNEQDLANLPSVGPYVLSLSAYNACEINEDCACGDQILCNNGQCALDPSISARGSEEFSVQTVQRPDLSAETHRWRQVELSTALAHGELLVQLKRSGEVYSDHIEVIVDPTGLNSPELSIIANTLCEADLPDHEIELLGVPNIENPATYQESPLNIETPLSVPGTPISYFMAITSNVSDSFVLSFTLEGTAQGVGGNN